MADAAQADLYICPRQSSKVPVRELVANAKTKGYLGLHPIAAAQDILPDLGAVQINPDAQVIFRPKDFAPQQQPPNATESAMMDQLRAEFQSALRIHSKSAADKHNKEVSDLKKELKATSDKHDKELKATSDKHDKEVSDLKKELKATSDKHDKELAASGDKLKTETARLAKEIEELKDRARSAFAFHSGFSLSHLILSKLAPAPNAPNDAIILQLTGLGLSKAEAEQVLVWNQRWDQAKKFYGHIDLLDVQLTLKLHKIALSMN